MKTIRTLFLVLSSIIILSCNNDDDTPQDFFPSKIVLTDYTNSISNKTVEINYNNDNTISQIVIEDNNGIKTKQYFYTNGKITSVTNTGFLGGPATRTFVYNNTGDLSSIIDETSGSTETFPISYNSTTNTYTVVDGGDTYSVILDNSNNPNQYSSSSFPNLTLTLDSTKNGIFKNVRPQIALQFDLALFNNGHLFYFFNQKQINHFEFGVQDFDVINTRDSSDNISSVIYNFTGGGSQIDITYQKRNLN